MFFRRDQPIFQALVPLVAGLFLLTTTPAVAESPRELLTKAEDYFLVADFTQALDQVNDLLQSGDLEGGVLRDAYVLKARCEVALAHRSSAVDAYCRALSVDESWRPDPDFFTKDEIEVFDQAKASCGPGTEGAPSGGDDRPSHLPPAMSESKPWYKNWKIVGPVAAVVVVGGILLLSGGDDDSGDPILSDFPPPPQ